MVTAISSAEYAIKIYFLISCFAQYMYLYNLICFIQKRKSTSGWLFGSKKVPIHFNVKPEITLFVINEYWITLITRLLLHKFLRYIKALIYPVQQNELIYAWVILCSFDITCHNVDSSNVFISTLKMIADNRIYSLFYW